MSCALRTVLGHVLFRGNARTLNNLEVCSLKERFDIHQRLAKLQYLTVRKKPNYNISAFRGKHTWQVTAIVWQS